MKKLLTVLTFAALGATNVQAQEVMLNPIYPVCDSLESFKELSAAFAGGDTRTEAHLLATKRCVKLKGRVPATLMETNWRGWVRVRVWINDQPLDLYTNYEATKEGK